MRKLAIIPARGGSKRIPGKNAKAFLGKPIIAYSIECALESGLFDEVMVSTDSEEIAAIARQYGAAVPFMRSEKTSDDYATTMDVIHEVLDDYSKKLQQDFQLVCCIYPTAPLLQAADMKAGLESLQQHEYTSVFPVVAFSYPIWRGVTLTTDNAPRLLWPEHLNARSQDLQKVYHDAGQWYWFNTQDLTNWTWPDNTGSVILPEERVQDIDTLTDWTLAELKYRLLKDSETSTHE